MRRAHLLLLPLILSAGCGDQASPPGTSPAPGGVTPIASSSPPMPATVASAPAPSIPATGATPGPEATKSALTEARRGFATKAAPNRPGNPAPEPPSDVFRLVHYDSPVGKLAAYITPDPGDRRRHPAIVWITGGDCNTIDALWEDSPRDNDQTAAAYRKAGFVMMFPSLRGGNDNPGQHEGFFGEVDDVLAATDYLARQDYVDIGRIYLGGHSTGGTLAMLAAESSDRFRAVFAFGPAQDVHGYPPEFLPFDASNPKEFELRSPGRWLDSARSPLLVFEGTEQPGNIEALRAMAGASKNPLIRFLPVKGANHFSILAPVNELIVTKIRLDAGQTTSIAFGEEELEKAMTAPPPSVVRASPSPAARQRPGMRGRLPRGRRQR